MLAFLKTYGLTILVLALLIAFVALVIGKQIKNKKEGKSSCGCDCSTCGACCPHSQNNT